LKLAELGTGRKHSFGETAIYSVIVYSSFVDTYVRHALLNSALRRRLHTYVVVPTPERGPVCSPFQTDVLRTLLKYFYTVIQVWRTHTSKRKIKYQSSILTPTRQSSNPWGLHIHFFKLFIAPLQLAGTIIAMGGHQAGSHKKQKPIRNSPAVSILSSTNLPRLRPPPSVTPESPTRHVNNGQLLFLSQSSTNSPPSSEPSSATTASFLPSPAAADSASLASAQVAPPQQAGHKRPQISKLSLDSESGVKRIKRSQLCLDSESLFSFLCARNRHNKDVRAVGTTRHHCSN
jgi:hypothetical protein